MKRFYLLTITLISTLTVMAQVPTNITVYDCDSNSKNIQDVLGTGKALIIASKGVDCSICKSTASSLQTWASNNKSKVEVWGAMTYRYNPNNFSPACQKTEDWDSTYSWNDIFAFPDTGRRWASNSYPRYYVYSAIDSSIVFQGSSSRVAQDSALSHSKITVGIKETSALDETQIIFRNGTIDLLGIRPNHSIQLYLFDMKGRKILSRTINNSSFSYSTSSLIKGVYIVQLQGFSGEQKTKKLLIQ